MNPDNRSVESTSPEQLRGRDALRDRIAELVEQARREIIVFAPQYERALFSTGRLSQAIASFATRQRQNRARFLVEDVGQLTRDNERLMELTRRFSDFINVHQVAEEHRGLRELFVVIDRTGFLRQEDIAVAAGVANATGKTQATTLAGRFEELWTHSTPLTGRLGVGR